jgi:uncharacterized protein (UPF0276 family)
MYQPSGTAFSRQELILNAKENIEWLRSAVRKHIAIGVENNNYLPTGAYQYVTDGEFISEIVEANKINFLFDLAHARITAHNRKISYDAYLASLPLAQAIQMHICKPGLNNDNIAFDAHELPDDAVLAETLSILKSSPIKYLTVEYYKESQGLVLALKKCRKMSEVLVNV